MYRVENIFPNQDSIKIEWNLGKRCNLDCAYCPAEIHDNISPYTNIDILTNTIDIISNFDKPVRLSFTGGEPCVHPDIETLIQYASERVKWLNVTTNSLRRGDWYERQPCNHYVFSLHFDNEHWERALDNILLFSQLNDDRKEFFVNVMAHHEYMDNVKLSIARLEGHDIKYAVRRIRWTEKHDWFDDLKYSANDLKWLISKTATANPNCLIDNTIKMHANDIIKNHLNQFEGWNCAAGVESLMINWDGEVHRATCRVGGSLGNIYNGSFKAPDDWVTCTRKFCTCAADIPLTKQMS